MSPYSCSVSPSMAARPSQQHVSRHCRYCCHQAMIRHFYQRWSRDQFPPPTACIAITRNYIISLMLVARCIISHKAPGDRGELNHPVIWFSKVFKSRFALRQIESTPKPPPTTRLPTASPQYWLVFTATPLTLPPTPILLDTVLILRFLGEVHSLSLILSLCLLSLLFSCLLHLTLHDLALQFLYIS